MINLVEEVTDEIENLIVAQSADSSWFRGSNISKAKRDLTNAISNLLNTAIDKAIEDVTLRRTL